MSKKLSKPKYRPTLREPVKCQGPRCDAMVLPRRPSRSGMHYCKKAACQRAKSKEWRLRNQALHPALRDAAPTKCANCKDDLPPRKVRSNDSPLGRWCSKWECRKAREAATSEVAIDPWVKAKALFFEMVAIGERMICPTCGLTNAIADLPHRDSFAKPCSGTGLNGELIGHLDPEWIDKVWGDGPRRQYVKVDA